MSIKRRKQCCLFDVFRKNDILKIVLTVVFLFLFTHTGAQESQLEGPQNTLSVVGSNVTLKCVSPNRNCSGTDWTKFMVSGTPMTIFKDGRMVISAGYYRERYSVDNSSGCNLVIENVQLTDAGRFICTAIISGNTPTKTAHLIILETQPKCMINASQDNTAEGDGVQLTCEVTCNGTKKTSIVWKGVERNAVENGKTTSGFSVVASAPEVPSFTCATSFAFETVDGSEPIRGLATNNIPNATCATSAISVLYSVRNVQLSPPRSYYSSESVITCTATGRPSPTFKWQEMENNGVWMDIPNQNGSQFTMTNISSKRFRCFAMNVVRSKSYNASSQEFQVNNTDSDDNVSVTDAPTATMNPLLLTLIVPIAVGVGVGVLLLIILLVICFCVRSCPGYQCCHSGNNSKAKIREEQPLTESPDIYSNINDAQINAPKAKPRSAPANERPKLPESAPPQARPRTDNKKAGPTNAYQHEEVTYAELAREDGPHQVAPKNNHHVPQETLYAAVGTA